MSAKVELNKLAPCSRLPIERRLVRFEYDDIDQADFHSNNAVISAFWVVLSASFPLGEAEFIKSVGFFESQITNEKLLAAVRDFSAQEAHHALQHKKVNKRFEACGYNIKRVEELMEVKLKKRSAHWSNKKRLRRTVAAEHFTAVMAHYTLAHPESLDSVPESFRNLLLWHSVEEVEHKSVAFDVYKHCVGDMRSLRRHYAFFAFIEFPLIMIMVTRFLLRDMGYQSNWQDRKGMWRFLFGKGGMISSSKHLYLMFFKKDFHPWKHDDSALVDQWKQVLAPHFHER